MPLKRLKQTSRDSSTNSGGAFCGPSAPASARAKAARTCSHKLQIDRQAFTCIFRATSARKDGDRSAMHSRAEARLSNTVQAAHNALPWLRNLGTLRLGAKVLGGKRDRTQQSK